MKSTFTLVLLALFSASVAAQELDSLKTIMENRQSPSKSESEDMQKNPSSPVTVDEKEDGVNIRLGDKQLIQVVDNDDSTYIKVGKNKILEVIDQPDSTRIRVLDREISISEKNDNSDIHVGRVNDNDFHQPHKFRGHWAGLEWGINNFLDKDFTLSREGDAAFMDMNNNRSWCFNLNFAQFSLGFGTSYFGILTGIGLQYNNYYFDNAYSLAEVDDYVQPVPLDNATLVRSKLTASFLRVPLILEGQFPGTIRSKRMFLSAGIVTAVKLGSHSKVVTKDAGSKNKDKNNDDFNISPFRYGLIARVGYGQMSVYGEYYFTSMFITDKGPELYPFSLGLSFSF